MIEVTGDVQAPRINTGRAHFILGWIAVALGVFLSFAAADGAEPGMMAVGGVVIAIGASLIAVGFWLSIAHSLELRMMDLQNTIRSESRKLRETPAP
jgi:hypothetical protein